MRRRSSSACPRRAARRLTVLAAAAPLLVALTGAAGPPTDCAPPAPGGDWPVYGHDLANTRTQPAEQELTPDVATGLRVAWSLTASGVGAGGDFTGTPVVADGCAFVGSNRGYVIAANADTGEPVWVRELPGGGVVNSSLAVHDGTVYAHVSRPGSPYVVALDASSGSVRWETVVDDQPGADAFASPVVWDDHEDGGPLLLVGISGDAAQHDDEDVRTRFHGSLVLLDARDGSLLRRVWTIPPEDWPEGHAGGTVTTTPAVDTEHGIAYVGTGSPFRPQVEHPHTNALLAVDVDRARSTFGRIVAAYKGDTLDDVVPGYSSLPCEDLPTPVPPVLVPAGRGIGACGDIDVDVAASPTLFRTDDGRRLVGTSQKSGTYHAARVDDLTPAWRTTFGTMQPHGGVSGAYDGQRLYGAAAPGYAYALDPTTGQRLWAAPIGDGAHYGHPVAVAAGVVYTMDLLGSVDAFRASDGLALAKVPLHLEGTPGSELTFGGLSVARGTVYAAIGIQHTGLDPADVLDGVLVALRPA